MHRFLCCSADVANMPSLSNVTIPTNSWSSSSTLLMIEGTTSKACLESNVELSGTGFLFVFFVAALTVQLKLELLLHML